MAHIKVGGGFVPKLDLCIRCQSPRQEGAAALAPGKPRHGPIRQMGNVQGPHRLIHKFPVVPKRMPPLGHYVAHQKRKIRLEILAHPGQPPSAFGERDVVQIFAHPRDGPFGLEQAREHEQQRGFPRPIRTHHSGEASQGQVQGHIAKARPQRDVFRADHVGLRSIHRKKGPPRSAVTTPRRSSPGMNRVMRSQASTKAAPPIMESGSRRR